MAEKPKEEKKDNKQEEKKPNGVYDCVDAGGICRIGTDGKCTLCGH